MFLVLGGIMKYICDDFKELKSKSGLKCTVGMFGENIYAMRLYVAIGHNAYYSQFFRIEKQEADSYPYNSDFLIEKYSSEKTLFLCSDYMGEGHSTYGFDE